MTSRDGEKAPRRVKRVSLALTGLLLLLLNGAPAALVSAQEPDQPAASPSTAKIGRLGERQAIIFSPDFAAPGNRRFYEALGFRYWESADWNLVLKEIKQFNRARPEDSILEVFFEAHGSNGHGLKLQESQSRSAPRSYISLGALQERLGEAGVERAILTACNTGRLFRPEIYRKLNMQVKDPTVLPATLGVINASKSFDPSTSSVALVRRTDSRIEQTSEGTYDELPESVRRALGLPDTSTLFSVSNMFIQMIIKDAGLQLTTRGFVRKISKDKESEMVNEAIFQSFLKFLDYLASDGAAAVRASDEADNRNRQ